MSPLVGVLDKVNNAKKSSVDPVKSTGDKSVKAKSNAGSVADAKKRHPAGKGRAKSGVYNFNWTNFDTRILTKLGKVPLKPAKDKDNVFVSTRSIGDFQVVPNTEQKIYLTQRFELTSPNSLIISLRVGPNPNESVVWSDQLQFELKSNRVTVIRKSPAGVEVKASYSQIHSGKAPEGMNFGGIDIVRLYKKLELAARMVAKDYFNAPELTESLTRFSDGDSLATTSFSKHKLDFSSPNFYTRPLYRFGKAKSNGKSVYKVSEKSGKLVTGKVYSMGDHTVYDGRTEKWYHNQRFVHADGITTGKLVITNSPNKELKAKTTVEIHLGIAKKGEQYRTTSALKIDDKTIYSDTLAGTFDSIIESVGKSKKLAWRVMDEPYARTFKLLVEGVTLIEELFLGGSEEEAPVKEELVVAPEPVGTAEAEKDIFVYGKDDIEELRSFFDTAPDVAQKTINLAVISLESEGTNTIHLIKKGDTRSVLMTEDNLFFDDISFRTTLGKMYTLSATKNGETISRRFDIYKNNGVGYEEFCTKFAEELLDRGFIPTTNAGVDRYLAMMSLYSPFSNMLVSKY